MKTRSSILGGCSLIVICLLAKMHRPYYMLQNSLLQVLVNHITHWKIFMVHSTFNVKKHIQHCLHFQVWHSCLTSLVTEVSLLSTGGFVFEF